MRCVAVRHREARCVVFAAYSNTRRIRCEQTLTHHHTESLRRSSVLVLVNDRTIETTERQKTRQLYNKITGVWGENVLFCFKMTDFGEM